MKGNTKRDAATERELNRIYEYKKRLIKLLNKLKNREIAMKDVSPRRFSWSRPIGRCMSRPSRDSKTPP